MQLYSHLVIAQYLRPALQPQDLAEYYWGAVAPDIRYLLKLPRRRTHPLLTEARPWLAAHLAGARDFALGYWAHLLADQRDAAGFLYERIPMRQLRKKLPRGLAGLLVEHAYIRQVPFQARLSGSQNALLDELGVPPAAAAQYAAALNAFLAQPTFPAALGAAEALGLAGNPRIQGYLRSALWLERSALLRRLALALVKLDWLTPAILAELAKEPPLTPLAP